jgi:hypothetical protein
MRRLLAIVLAAAPLFAGAQTSGQILFDSNTTATLNRTQCQTDTMKVDFLLKEQTIGAFVSGTGQVDVYSASADKTDAVFPPCHYVGDGTTGATVGAILASPISNPTSLLGTASGPIATLANRAGFDCTTADQTIYVCAVYRATAGATPVAYAKGTVTLKVTAPGKPTVTSVTPGDGALSVSATTPDGSSGGTAVPAVAWRAKAVAADGVPHFSAKVAVDALARIGGLVNGVPYTVTAFSYSANDNESLESDPFGSAVAPQPTANAWEVYKLDGGRDTGGCQSGGAGLGALLGAAALLGIRRRS